MPSVETEPRTSGTLKSITNVSKSEFANFGGSQYPFKCHPPPKMANHLTHMYQPTLD